MLGQVGFLAFISSASPSGSLRTVLVSYLRQVVSTAPLSYLPPEATLPCTYEVVNSLSTVPYVCDGWLCLVSWVFGRNWGTLCRSVRTVRVSETGRPQAQQSRRRQDSME